MHFAMEGAEVRRPRNSNSVPSAESEVISHSHFHCRDFRVPFRVFRGKNPVPIPTFKARTIPYRRRGGHM